MQVYVELPIKEDRKYPYVGENNTGIIVYFSSPTTGVNLTAKESSDSFYSNCWNEHLFEPLPKGSKVILEA